MKITSAVSGSVEDKQRSQNQATELNDVVCLRSVFLAVLSVQAFLECELLSTNFGASKNRKIATQQIWLLVIY